MIASEVAAKLGVSQGSVRQFVVQGFLVPSRKIHGRMNWFDAKEVKRFAREHGYPKEKTRKRC